MLFPDDESNYNHLKKHSDIEYLFLMVHERPNNEDKLDDFDFAFTNEESEEEEDDDLADVTVDNPQEAKDDADDGKEIQQEEKKNNDESTEIVCCSFAV